MQIRYNFQIMYKPGLLNHADALTRREQDSDALRTAKSSSQLQTSLAPEQVDPRIQLELATDQTVCALELDASLDLVDNLLQTNRTSESLTDLRERALLTAVTKDPTSQWKLVNGLLMYQNRLVVAED